MELIYEKSQAGRRAGRVPSYGLPVPEVPAALARTDNHAMQNFDAPVMRQGTGYDRAPSCRAFDPQQPFALLAADCEGGMTALKCPRWDAAHYLRPRRLPACQQSNPRKSPALLRRGL